MRLCKKCKDAQSAVAASSLHKLTFGNLLWLLLCVREATTRQCLLGRYSYAEFCGCRREWRVKRLHIPHAYLSSPHTLSRLLMHRNASRPPAPRSGPKRNPDCSPTGVIKRSPEVELTRNWRGECGREHETLIGSFFKRDK